MTDTIPRGDTMPNLIDNGFTGAIEDGYLDIQKEGVMGSGTTGG